MMLVGNIHADPLGLLIAFGGGMLSFLSPCVLPLVPGYLSMVSGLSAAELDSLRPSPPATATSGSSVLAPLVSVSASGPSVSGVSAAETVAAPTAGDLRSERGRLLRGILLFIAGFTVVFTILGASASAVGHAFHTHLPELTRVSGFLIVAFGLILVAMASGIRLPNAVTGERRFLIRPSLLGAWAPPVMGAAFAFAWTPCIGPILASVLTLAAGTGGTTTGGIALLLAYSLGLGVPFLLFGLAFGRMTDLLARFRGRLRLVDLVGGAVLIAFGILLVTGNVDVISVHISNWLHDLHLGRLATS
ncbi:MAG TPA: cytochrome c biogenesis protein CcdA [Acidimicrobiales bacterium]|jgi:cytochrome c-type biogenesis protein|nr:cytochrome c biogenesis protein CcdA [Acidimicrobiales bacterium]